jgi:hypothetical protein
VRTAEYDLCVADSRPDTWQHIETVRAWLHRCVLDLLRRGQRHDHSKLAPPELEAFDRMTPGLAETTVGTPEYEDARAALGAALEHHYQANSHHPEHGERPPLEWQPVADYEGLYDVSNHGDVRSVARTVSRGNGEYKVQERIRTAQVGADGRLRIILYREGIGESFQVHRLVAEAFIPNPDGKPIVNHLDGDPKHNAIGNLSWATSSEDVQHAYDTGLNEQEPKYVVYCPELDLTTMGANKMAAALRAHGHETASASNIRACISGKRSSHRGLTFEGTLLAEWRRSRIRSMSILDLIEMVCDWKAAGERHEDGGDLHRSIEVMQERFGYGDELKSILHKTADALSGLSA